ncbi:MAG: prepilin-type N-terminal cleavage/methylation domain-containing protein [Candidatus Omnitrophota bacterium]|nr:prepilin-type N-terminal cleavage/methylation domain-containing protein [Candidatus Omnitrophota bacterium]MDZ4242719.1 prepilin-type N-terminal cleavage/methylation domain-containing protein [Candidatus Omnitrophota bacterium]
MRDMMFHRKRHISRRGFTLTEVMIAVFIFTILAAACYGLMAAGSSSWQVNRVKSELYQEMRKAQDWMIADLRQAGSTSVTDVTANGTWFTACTFRTSAGVSGGTIAWSGNTIQFSKGGTNSSQLLRTTGGVTRVLANNVQTLQFRRLSATPRMMEVSLQTQKNVPGAPAVTANLNFKVQLRN